MKAFGYRIRLTVVYELQRDRMGTESRIHISPTRVDSGEHNKATLRVVTECNQASAWKLPGLQVYTQVQYRYITSRNYERNCEFQGRRSSSSKSDAD